MEISQKICPVSKVNPAAGRETTTMLQSCQITKPRNSAKIDHRRLRAAIRFPPPSHCSGSSAFQLSIQRPGRIDSAGASIFDVSNSAEGVSVWVKTFSVDRWCAGWMG